MKYLLLLPLLLASCQQSATTDTAQAARNLTYFQDTHGNCFAALNSASSSGYRITSITTVPCERTPVGGQ